MWLMLQQKSPDDFVIASGETHSVREFVEAAFAYIGKEIIWEGKGVEEVGKEKQSGTIRVKVNARYFRPTEVVCFSKYFKLIFIIFKFFLRIYCLEMLLKRKKHLIGPLKSVLKN